MNVVQLTTATAQPAQVLVLQAEAPTLLCENIATAPLLVIKQEQDQTSEDPPASPTTTKSTGRVGGILARAKGQKAESTNTPTAAPKSTGRVGGLVARAKRAGVGATSNAAARAKQVKGIFLPSVSLGQKTDETSPSTASGPANAGSAISPERNGGSNAKPVMMSTARSTTKPRVRVLRKLKEDWDLVQIEGADENPGDPAPRLRYKTPCTMYVMLIHPGLWLVIPWMLHCMRSLERVLPKDAVLCDQTELELLKQALQGKWFHGGHRSEHQVSYTMPVAVGNGEGDMVAVMTFDGVTPEYHVESLTGNSPVPLAPRSRSESFQFSRAASQPDALFTDAWGSRLVAKIDAANPSPAEIELATEVGGYKTFAKWVRKHPNAAS
ncbi:unnamed protein product [Amoebophrya sp. A120]|nr:unnamed protein product [Amoebophrya sp. A120]|eukprot:GSA120T00003675001.1